jgi:hypothetical protein
MYFDFHRIKYKPFTITVPGGGWINISGDDGNTNYEVFFANGNRYEPEFYVYP